jgi:YVTN family beta-propeller protein
MRRWTQIAAVVLATGQTTTSAVAAERMFVPLGDGNAIVVIDIAEDKVIGRIDDVSAAHGLAGTPDGRFLIAGSSRTRGPGTAPVKPAGVAEEDHTAHHAPGKPGDAGTVAVVSTVTIIRQSDLRVERQIDVPGAVHHVAASPDSRFAVVTHPARNGITVIDLVTLEARPLVATGPGANYAVFSNDGALVYVSNGGNGTVTALNTKTWKVVQTFKVGKEPEHLAMAPNGRHLYVNNVKSGTVSEIYLIDPRRTREYRVGANPHGVDVSDDSDWSYVAVQGDNKLVAITRKRQPQRTLTLAPEPYHLAVVRGRGKIYVSSAKEPKIWVVDAATLTVLREIPIGGKGHQMVQGPRS